MGHPGERHRAGGVRVRGVPQTQRCAAGVVGRGGFWGGRPGRAVSGQGVLGREKRGVCEGNLEEVAGKTRGPGGVRVGELPVQRAVRKRDKRVRIHGLQEEGRWGGDAVVGGRPEGGPVVLGQVAQHRQTRG